LLASSIHRKAPSVFMDVIRLLNGGCPGMMSADETFHATRGIHEVRHRLEACKKSASGIESPCAARESVSDSARGGTTFFCDCWRLSRRLPDVDSHWAPPSDSHSALPHLKCPLALRCHGSLFMSKAQSTFLRAIANASTGMPSHMSVHAMVANECGWRFEYKSTGGASVLSSKGRDTTVIRRMKAAVSKFADASPFAVCMITVEGNGKILQHGSGPHSRFISQ